MLLEKIKSLAAAGQTENIAIRRHLHANPELSYQEFETCKFVQAQLNKIGIPFSVIATTGVLGIIEGKNPSKRVIALRADMDALPIIEENEVDYKSKNDEPKIWFSSIKSLAHVLSEENRHLLKLIIEQKPQSVSELEPLTGRKANNLLRTLRTMENYGFVRLNKSTEKRQGRSPLIPQALYDMVDIKLNFCFA